MGIKNKNYRSLRANIRGHKRFLYSVKRKGKCYNPIFPETIVVPTNKPPKYYRDKEIRKRLPSEFSINSNIEEVVAFFSDFSTYKYKHVRKVDFDMSDVTMIDIGAIVMLLTHVTKLVDEQIFVTGNYPKDERCRLIFEDSGFLEHVKEINARKKNSNCEFNLIVKTGRTKTESVLTGTTIKKALKHITGSEQHYTPVQSIVQEMAGNAVEHAYGERKFWLFCVNLSNDELVFVLSDAGKGILNTLNRKYKKIIDTLSLKDNKEILYRAYEKKYNSITDEVNRNKGLPLIKHISDKRRIKDLKVVTNNVYLDFNNLNESKNLKHKYSGTLYIWKIDKEILESYGKDNKSA